MINELPLTTGAETTISRDTWPQALQANYETVIVREGKPAIDAEVNELGDITLKERLELTRDVFYDGFIKGDVFGDAISRESFEVSWNGVNVFVAAGRGRIAQRRCDLTAILSSGVSGNALSGFAAPSSGVGNYKFIYVDVFRREFLGNPANPPLDATNSVPGNDPTLSDPTLGGEQARRIQWFNANTDIKATAQNTAVPAPVAGHTIEVLAKVYRDASDVVVVQDLRKFGGVKAANTIAEFVVRENGTPSVDCTHIDFMDAYADALLVSPTKHVTIWVINGNFVVTQTITLTANLCVRGRTELDAEGGVMPSLSWTSAQPTVEMMVGSSFTNMTATNAGAGAGLKISGSGVYVENVKAVNTSSAPAFSHGVAFQKNLIKDSVLGYVSVGASGPDVTFSNCVVSGGDLGNSGVMWRDCSFQVPGGAVNLSGGVAFSGCTFTGTFTWTLTVGNEPALRSCVADGAVITLLGTSGVNFKAYSSSFLTLIDGTNGLQVYLNACWVTTLDFGGAIISGLTLTDSIVYGNILSALSNIRLFSTDVQGTLTMQSAVVDADSSVIANISVTGEGATLNLNTTRFAYLIVDNTVTAVQLNLSDCRLDSIIKTGPVGGVLTMVGCTADGNVNASGIQCNIKLSTIGSLLSLGSPTSTVVESTIGVIIFNSNSSNYTFERCSTTLAYSNVGISDVSTLWTDCSIGTFTKDGTVAGSFSVRGGRISVVDASGALNVDMSNVTIENSLIIGRTTQLSGVHVIADIVSTTPSPSDALTLTMRNCTVGNNLSVVRTGSSNFDIIIRNSTVGGTASIVWDGTSCGVDVANSTFGFNLVLTLLTTEVPTSNVVRVALSHVDCRGIFTYTVGGVQHTKIQNSSFQLTDVVIQQTLPLRYSSVLFENCSFGVRQLNIGPILGPVVRAVGQGSGGNITFECCVIGPNYANTYVPYWTVVVGSALAADQNIVAEFRNTVIKGGLHNATVEAVHFYNNLVAFGVHEFHLCDLTGDVYTDQNIGMSQCYLNGYTNTGAGVINPVIGAVGPVGNLNLN